MASEPIANRPTPLGLSVLNKTSAAMFALVSLIYFYRAITLAAEAPLWMDEILTLWTARMPDIASVWMALKKGSEFTPPLYITLMHLLVQLDAGSVLLWRMPSIVAGYVCALGTGWLVQRRLGWQMAALAAGVVLASGLFEYAVQMRPYVFVVALFSWVLVLWDDLPESGRLPLMKLTAMTALMVAMVATHFYAVLLVGALGLAEIIRNLARRQWPRPAMVVALGLAVLSIFLWMPILQSAFVYNRQEVFAPGYYAQPHPMALVAAYQNIGGWPGVVGLCMALVYSFTRRDRLIGKDVLVPAVIVCAFPALAYVFAVFISHAFSIRYAIGGALGIAMLLAWAVSQMGRSAPVISVCILIALGATLAGRNGGEVQSAAREETLAAINQAQGDLPIAIGSGLRFFEAMANLRPEVARRVTYLDVGNVNSIDPTNRNQVKRWKALNPPLPVMAARDFVCANPTFLVLIDPNGGVDDLPQWLSRHTTFYPKAHAHPVLVPVQSKPCAPQP